jgi:hypothetical protein
MSEQHTPRPWEYRGAEHDDWGIVRGGEVGEWGMRGIICQARDPKVLDGEVLNEHRRAKTDPWEANARLIAAAPELLEALEEAADTFDKFAADLREEDSELHAQRIAVAELKAEEAHAAIAKARGAS